MARITVEDCLTKENNRFALVLLASKRTKQLLTGAPVLSSEKRHNKSVVTALREIAEGKVRFMTEEEARMVAEEEQQRQEEESQNREREGNGSGVTQSSASVALSLQSLMGINRPRIGEAGSDTNDDEEEE